MNEQDANKKPAPREGRVVLAQVVKSVNTGDCHSSGICSLVYKPYGSESRPGQPKAPVIIIVTGGWFVKAGDGGGALCDLTPASDPG